MRFLFCLFLFVGGCHHVESRVSYEDLIRIAISEARKNDSAWKDVAWDPVVRDLPDSSPLWEEGAKVVSVFGIPSTPGCEADVVIRRNGEVVAYLGGK